MNNRALIESIGEKCEKCGTKMQRRKHPRAPDNKSYRKWYFSEWDYCTKCPRVQQYGKFKVFF